MIYNIRVAGVTANNRQELLKNLPYRKNMKFKLVREKDNQYDEFAIAVYTNDNQQVGYVPKTCNKLICEKLDNGIIFDVIGHVDGGYAKGVNFGITLACKALNDDEDVELVNMTNRR